jgi:DNA-binding transcriptional ArsR family regulator
MFAKGRYDSRTISIMNEREKFMAKMEVECCDITCVHKDMIQKVKEILPKEDLLKELADFYKVFGEATRVKILCVLLESEMCVCDLAELLDMTQSAISHQLRVLKQMKLVKNRREGKTVYYSLTDGHIQNIISQGMEHIQE